MMSALKFIRDWTEVWSLIIPLLVIIYHRGKFRDIKPVVIYVIVAFILNLVATTQYNFNSVLPTALKNNNIFYNLHSIARVAFFSWYIIGLRHHRYVTAYKVLLS